MLRKSSRLLPGWQPLPVTPVVPTSPQGPVFSACGLKAVARVTLDLLVASRAQEAWLPHLGSGAGCLRQTLGGFALRQEVAISQEWGAVPHLCLHFCGVSLGRN